MASAAPATRDDAWLAGAIARYHALCSDARLAGPDIVSSFVRAQRDAGLTFGGTVQCRTLRPAFITPSRLGRLRSAVDRLWPAFRALEQQALRDDGLARAIGMSEDERELAAIDPGYDDATIVSRLDTFFDERPCVIEYNADSPAGMSYQAGQAELMAQLPVMQRFAADHNVEPLRADVALRETLLAVWSEFATRKGIGERPLPSVAIVDLTDAATGTEFQLVARDLEAHGVRTVIATPDDVTYHDGRLMALGREIDLVYKRLLVADLLAHFGMGHPLIRAYAAGDVCVASSMRCTIAHKKKALGVLLADPGNASWLPARERAATCELIAPTRPYADADRELLVATQPSWVLKPNDAHGGDDVTVGLEAGPDLWRRALDRAASNGYVVQQRVAPTHGIYPVFDPDAPQDGARLRSLIEDCNAYVFRGVLGGVLTRLSDDPVINVSRGGQAIPTFVLTPR